MPKNGSRFPLTVVLLAFVIAGSTVTFCRAAPIFNPANGHYYDVNDTELTWPAARDAAAALIYNPGSGPLQGYLVTITSAAENSFLVANFGSTFGRWIGASDAAVEGDWQWVTGPEAGQSFWLGGPAPGGSSVGTAYSNWKPSEPNNFNFLEDYAIFDSAGWSDIPGSSSGFSLVEFSSTTDGPEPSTVPEPSAFALAAFGLLSLAFVGRRRRRR